MTFDEMIQQAQAFEDARQNKDDEVDDDAVEALCNAIGNFDVQTVEHMHGLILLTGLNASWDLRSKGSYALRDMNPTLVAGEFNTMLRGNEEQRDLAMGALTEMHLKVTWPVAVAMNEAGGVVDFLLEFLASDAPGLSRSSAATLLGSIGADLGRVVPALEAAAASDDDWVIQDAEWALEKIADR
jgi:hypothetical protein